MFLSDFLRQTSLDEMKNLPRFLEKRREVFIKMSGGFYLCLGMHFFIFYCGIVWDWCLPVAWNTCRRQIGRWNGVDRLSLGCWVLNPSAWSLPPVAAGVGNWFFLMVGLGLVSLADDGIGEGSKESLDDFRCLVELVLDVVTQKCEIRSEWGNLMVWHLVGDQEVILIAETKFESAIAELLDGDADTFLVQPWHLARGANARGTLLRYVLHALLQGFCAYCHQWACLLYRRQLGKLLRRVKTVD